MTLKIGALFAGYGGLDLGVQAALGGHPAWFSEYDAAPSRILAHHWPHVPNHGDVTAIDWAAVEPVDVLTGGFPCQDVSGAGLRRGLKPDTRSGLWSHFALAISELRPGLVIVENVRGLLSAEAHSYVEPDPWDLGGPERQRGPALRALGAVLGDLADLGYDARWAGVRAADAGAPHGRFRVFIVAAPADSGRIPRLEGREGRPGATPGAGASSDPRGRDRTPSAAPDTDRRRHGREQERRGLDRLDRPDEGPARERRGTRREPLDRSPQAAPDPLGGGLDRRASDPLRGTPERAPAPRSGEVPWGSYEPAVRRWERVTSRTAPDPTEPGPTGAARLSPRFVEWMMGLQPGHVTDPAIGLTRNEQLKALGNGVVPQQAALAIRALLAPAAPIPEEVPA